MASFTKPAASTLLLLLFPLLLQAMGLHWVRVLDLCLLYVALGLGMNIVVGFAGLLDLGYIAFYALGAYAAGLLTSPHLTDQFAVLAAAFPAGLQTPWWLVLVAGTALAAACGMLLGAPTLRLRGDYLAVVTLGFGEIVRLLVVNLSSPVDLTGGARGLGPIAPVQLLGLDLGRPLVLGPIAFAPVTLYAYLLLVLAALAVLVSVRLQSSRLGRAWVAMREDEPAAAAMGLDLRRLKLAAFGIGAAFGGLAGCVFGALQVFISPEAFSLQESMLVVAIVVLGGPGRVRGVVLAALFLTGLPELLRYVVGPLQAMTDGRLDAGVLRPLCVAVAMIVMVRLRPDGLAAGLARSAPASRRAARRPHARR